MKAILSSYVWPGQTHFGFGAAALAGAQARALHGSHVFVLADPGVVALGLVEAILPSLAQARLAYTVYERIVPNPDVASVDAAAAAYRESGADLIIGMGGGSAIDTAKAVRLLAASPSGVSIAEYSFLRGAAVRPLPDARTFPAQIAIPTAAGTGAEATPWGVITEPENKRKFGFGGPELVPTVALVDPELTLGLPPFLTAATGFDALTHLIEAFVSTQNHQPALDPMILYGIGLISRNLRRVVAQGADRQARSDMMHAALLGGIAISSNWLGACHALAHPLSGIAHVQHGVANAIMLPHQMAYSLPAALERYVRIAAALDPAAIQNGSLRQRAERAVELVRELLIDVNLPTRLRDVGVTEAMIEPLSEQASCDGNIGTTPRPVTKTILAELYRAAW